MHPVHSAKPNRRPAVNPQVRYQNYKADLRQDFSQKCGYCDASDRFFGGLDGYHIDHFAPKSRFPNLSSTYVNLVYSCPYCNIAKSNKWIGDDFTIPHNGTEGFVDPCSDDYDTHLERDAEGIIRHKSPVGEYMIKQLKLHLMRHQYIWTYQRLEKFSERALILKQIVPSDQPDYVSLLELIIDIGAGMSSQTDLIFGPK
jgi:uncharacterized protein (TIGR02646 family)